MLNFLYFLYTMPFGYTVMIGTLENDVISEMTVYPAVVILPLFNIYYDMRLFIK